MRNIYTLIIHNLNDEICPTFYFILFFPFHKIFCYKLNLEIYRVQ